jgi:hypothetical protein
VCLSMLEAHAVSDVVIVAAPVMYPESVLHSGNTMAHVYTRNPVYVRTCVLFTQRRSLGTSPRGHSCRLRRC